MLTSAVLVPQRVRLAELAVRNRLPAIYSNSQYVEAGGLMFYGVNVLNFVRARPRTSTKF